MNKKILWALGFLAGIFTSSKPVKDLDEKVALSEALAKKTDWKDKHHLRYCDETYLDKRFLPYKSAVNMRDIGGYTNNLGKMTKWKKIYRGEELCHLNKEDQEKFDKLGITHVFDLRTRERALAFPDHIPPGATYTSIPVLEGIDAATFIEDSYPNITDQFMRNLYINLVEKSGDLFAKVIKVLADEPDAIIYVHCENGKDRTGIMICMIELLAQLPMDRVVSDYSLSNQNYERANKLFNSKLDLDLGPKLSELLYGLIGVDPDWLGLATRYMQINFEGIEDYLLRNSLLTKEDFENFRKNVLEDV